MKLKMRVTIANATLPVSIFQFTKIVNKDDYGNGTYVRVERDGNLWQYIDHRYSPLGNFTDCCTAILRNYFGENLTAAEVID